MKTIPRHTYRLHGLTVELPLALPGARRIPTAAQPADLTVRFGKLDATRRVQPPQVVRLNVPSLGRFEVTRGTTIVIDPDSRATEHGLLTCLLGPIFAVACQQRGLLAVSGSAIRIGDAAALIIGAKGCGKSTLAAQAARQGYPLVSDGLCVLRVNESGSPQLWPGAGYLGLSGEGLDFITRSAGPAPRFDDSDGPLPLHGIYCIADGRGSTVTTSEQVAAIRNVSQAIQRSTCLRHVALFDVEALAERLADKTPVFKLVRARGILRTAEHLVTLTNHWERQKVDGPTAVKKTTPKLAELLRI